MRKAIFLGLIVSCGVFLGVGNAQAWEGSNTVPVDNCVQVSNGVSITRFGSTYTLTNGVRDAGHGLRDYYLTCVSSTIYKVQWNPAPVQDYEKPSADVTLKTRTLKTNNYDASFEVSGSDTLSPVVRINAFVLDAEGNTFSASPLNWIDNNSTSKNVTKSFSLSNFKYNTTYYVYAYVTDKVGNVKLDIYILQQTQQAQDMDTPVVALSEQYKNLKPTNFDLTLNVSGSDATSPISKMEVYSYGYGYNGPVFVWGDSNGTAKQVSKNFTLSNLVYNKLYNFYAKVFDKSGKSSITHLTNVSEAALMPTCNTTISGYGYYTLCLNQTATYNSNFKVTNIYAANSALILKVNDSSYVTFTLGEEKIVEGPYGVKVRVKFNSLDQQQNASIIISQA